MEAILSADSNWGIGKDNELLAHVPEDMKFFREKTVGKAIVIGRLTLESFPGGRPLPDRTNIVLTNNSDYRADGCVVCCGMEKLKEVLGERNDAVVCGGSSVYGQLLPMVDTVWVTRFYKEFEADSFFPDLDEDGCFEIGWKSDLKEHKGLSYRFFRYDRVRKEENE